MSETVAQPPARKPQAPSSATPEESASLSAVWKFALSEGAHRRDREWIEFLGPLARDMDLTAFLASAGAVS